MKFSILLDVPEEMISHYKSFLENNEETKLLDLNEKETIESLIKDMIEEQTSWEVKKCELVED